MAPDPTPTDRPDSARTPTDRLGSARTPAPTPADRPGPTDAAPRPTDVPSPPGAAPVHPRTTPSAPTSPGTAAWKAHVTATIVHATLDALVDAAPTVADPLAAELLGSDACGIWWTPAEQSEHGLPERERRVGRTYAAHLEDLGTAAALAGLRALQIGGADGVVPEASAAAERMAAAGIPEPVWWADAPRITPLRGARVSWTDDDHRFTSYLLEMDRAGQVVNLAVATLDDCSGVIGDVLLFSDLDGFKRVVEDSDQDRHMEWMGVGSVQARISRAIDRTDLLGTGPPPGSSEPEAGYVAMRGLAQRWTAVSPPGA
ncbi:hypothetical protein [Patulibacter minatonensis]|uniref:hypothetical protein n=1 Tax=Patulibacter minatonensis TaxID=298163 RepID=UPI0012FC48A9|nr:hypothetical protein [Patulibacter minatonensis]